MKFLSLLAEFLHFLPNFYIPRETSLFYARWWNFVFLWNFIILGKIVIYILPNFFTYQISVKIVRNTKQNSQRKISWPPYNKMRYYEISRNTVPLQRFSYVSFLFWLPQFNKSMDPIRTEILGWIRIRQKRTRIRNAADGTPALTRYT